MPGARAGPSCRAASARRSPRAAARPRARVAVCAPDAGCCARSQVLLLHDVGLDHVTFLEVVEVAERDAAVVVLDHLAHVVLETLQRLDPAGRDLGAVAEHLAR